MKTKRQILAEIKRLENKISGLSLSDPDIGSTTDRLIALEWVADQWVGTL